MPKEKEKNILNINNDDNNAPIWPSSEEEGELAIDMLETKNELVIRAFVGIKADELDISINNDMVTIRGERKQEEEEIKEAYYSECFWGPFSRSIILPCEVDSDKTKATIKNGLIIIRLPKFEKSKKKILEIEEG